MFLVYVQIPGAIYHRSHTGAYHYEKRALILHFYAEPHTCFHHISPDLANRNNMFLRFKQPAVKEQREFCIAMDTLLRKSLEASGPESIGKVDSFLRKLS